MMQIPRFGRRKKQKQVRTSPVIDARAPDPESREAAERSAKRPPNPPDYGYVKPLHTVMAINRGLMAVVLVLVVTVSALGFTLMQSRKWIPVYVPPDTSQGAFLTAYTPPANTVYGFGYQTLQALYHWPADGQRDYRANIDRLNLYLTPRFRTWLLTDLSRLANRAGINELRDRSRALHPLPEALFSSDRINRIGDGVWEAGMDFRLVEELSGLPVKDIGIRYRVRIVQADVDPTGNQWGLLIDGFTADPERIDLSGGGS